MPNNALWTPEEESKLAEYLVDQVCNRGSGRSEDECLRNYPHDVYFLGNLRPQQEVNPLSDDPAYLRELINKLSPVAFGAEFCIQSLQGQTEIDITVRWTCYYRVFPTLQQQREHQQQQASDTNEDASEQPQKGKQIKETQSKEMEAISKVSTVVNEEETNEEEDTTIAEEEERSEKIAEAESPEIAASSNDRRRTRTPKDTLFIRFRKLHCQATGKIALDQDIQGEWIVDTDDLQNALNKETERAKQVALQDSIRVRTAGKPEDKIKVPEPVLTSEETYNTFLQSLQTDILSEWQWEIRREIRQSSAINAKECELLIEFVNTSPMIEKAPNTDAYFFDTEAAFTFNTGEVKPFELELAPKSFRYDRHLWGRGFNCAIERTDEKLPIFTTTHTPRYKQKRYTTQNQPEARFTDLAQNTIPTLRAIVAAMQDYKQVWEQEKRAYIARDPNWQGQFGTEFDDDQLRYEAEITRFRQGCELIRTNSDIKLAFQLTNETFQRIGVHQGKDKWRLFQIVFLVSQIPGIAALTSPNSPYMAEREKVDIIYFPTGGGKTEAYLGTIIFHCFFDRLRGKAAGVTVWTRFPLRLLTLQQTQRVADVIGVAELVRKGHTDVRLNGHNVDGFAIGYFVGAEGTPNEITDPTKYSYASEADKVLWSKANDPKICRNWKRISRCPSCQTRTVEVKFEPSSSRVTHYCTQTNCAFPNGIIPIYVVDNEIYRYLPSVIVGTIDKLAGIGSQRKLALVFGQAEGRCPEHGYYKGKCCQKECTCKLKAGVPSGLSGPTLIVQDELHLLKEGLGTFDAHYETFMQRLIQNYAPTPPLKIIASSATIEAFDRQIAHLYGRSKDQARVFPGLGPTARQSFYAETLDHSQRLFVGLIPHNKTIFNTILELIEFYHREIQQLQHIEQGKPNPYGGKFIPGTAEWNQLLDYYITSLTYFLAGRELNSIRTDLNGDVNPKLQRIGLNQFDIHELTGSTSTDDVTVILERLERTATSKTQSDAVLATSMVSHGVDIDRFNMMIFYGMPRQTAEYIQASSRVGRSHVGIVFTCLHPARERDQSHYTYFVKYHEFLGQLVEPVAINRWSKFSIDRTLPGLFMGVLLQVIANRSIDKKVNQYYMLEFVRQKISEGSLQLSDFIPLLEEAYLVNPTNTIGEQEFRQKINTQIKLFLDQIITSGSRSKFVSEVLIPKPMRSLRDVDEAIEIELDSSGTQWANKPETH